MSALAVSALLPGVDLYGTALFAGETPSPEMVAAAGDLDTVIGARAAALLVAAFLALGALAGWMYDRSTVAGQTAMRKPAPVLAEYAWLAGAASSKRPSSSVSDSWDGASRVEDRCDA